MVMMRCSLRQFSDLVGQVYDAGLGTTSWGEVAERLRSLIGANTVSLFLKEENGVHSFVQMLNPDAVQAYVREFSAHDLWHHESLRQGVFGRAARGSEAVPTNIFERSYFYNEFSRVYRDGAFYCCGVADWVDTAVGVLALHRKRHEGDFGVREIELLEGIRPHIYRALDLARKLEHGSSDRALFERWPTGLVEVTSNLKVRRVNERAEHILSASDGIRCSGGRLFLTVPSEDREFQKLLHEVARTTTGAVGGSGGYVSVTRPSGAPSYRVLIAPNGGGAGGRKAHPSTALVLIADPAAKSLLSASALQAWFGLTPAEARVVCSLASGQSLTETAEAAGTTYATVRTLLSRAMSKLGVGSQASMVSLLGRLPVIGR